MRSSWPVGAELDALLAPGYPHYYWGTYGMWSNDWMYMAVADVGACVKQYGIALNTALTPERTNFLAPAFDEIACEERHQFTGWEEVVELLLCRLLLLSGRELKRSSMSLSPTEAEHLESLSVLRQNLSENWQHPGRSRKWHFKWA